MSKLDKDDHDSELLVDDDHRYFLHPDSVSKHLFCSICCDVFFEPQRAPCGHSYCKTCISQWLMNSSTCPDDRKPLKQSQLHHDFILESIIGDQMVACPFRKLGCEYVGQLQRSSSHKKECTFNPSNMPDFLKQDALKNSFNKQTDTVSADSDDCLPEPAKPSLKMRLFSAGGGRRELLCSMFQKTDTDTRDNKSDSKSDVKETNKGKSDGKSRSKSRKRKSST